MPARRLALFAALAVALPAAADDAPKPADPPKPAAPGSSVLAPARPQLHSAGHIEAKVGKVDGSTITLKLPEVEQTQHNGGEGRSMRRGRGLHLQRVEKDHDFDLADEVKVRWKDLPKGPDGKAKQYTDEEYKKLREPANAPGFKAELSDLKPGQTVRVYLSKAGKDDKPVATTVLILADAPKDADKPSDAGKAKKKKD